MATQRISSDTAEPGRRALVANIAQRGSAALRTERETTFAPRHLERAGVEAMKRDPVDLGSAGQAAIRSILGEPTEKSERYAANLRAIFDRSRGRELAEGHQFYDDFGNVIEGTNVELDRYNEDLLYAQQQALARSSRGGGGGGRRGGGGGGGGGSNISLGDIPPETDSGFDGDPAVIGDDMMRGFYEDGQDLNGSLWAVDRELRRLGVDPQVVAEIVDVLRRDWTNAFRDQEIVGGYGGYDPSTGQIITNPSPAPSPLRPTF